MVFWYIRNDDQHVLCLCCSIQNLYSYPRVLKIYDQLHCWVWVSKFNGIGISYGSQIDCICSMVNLCYSEPYLFSDIIRKIGMIQILIFCRWILVVKVGRIVVVNIWRTIFWNYIVLYVVIFFYTVKNDLFIKLFPISLDRKEKTLFKRIFI